MDSRREFFKKAGIAAGVGAIGAATLKKEYVKPVIGVLDTRYAMAQTPVYVAQWTWLAGLQLPGTSIEVPAGGAIPCFGLDVALDVPGASPPRMGTLLDVSVNYSVVKDDDGSMLPDFPVGTAPTSSVLENVGLIGENGSSAFLVCLKDERDGEEVVTLNSLVVPELRESAYVGDPTLTAGDELQVSLNVWADATWTTDENPVPRSFVGTTPPFTVRVI